MDYSDSEIRAAVIRAEKLGLSEFLYKDPPESFTGCHSTRHHPRSSSHCSSSSSHCSSRHSAFLALPVALFAIPAAMFGAFVSIMSTLPNTDLSHRSSCKSSRHNSRSRRKRSSHSSRIRSTNHKRRHSRKHRKSGYSND